MYDYRRTSADGNFTQRQAVNLGSAAIGDVVGDQEYIAVSFPSGISFQDGANFRSDGIIQVYKASDISKSIYTIRGTVNERFIG